MALLRRVVVHVGNIADHRDNTRIFDFHAANVVIEKNSDYYRYSVFAGNDFDFRRLKYTIKCKCGCKYSHYLNNGQVRERMCFTCRSYGDREICLFAMNRSELGVHCENVRSRNLHCPELWDEEEDGALAVAIHYRQ